MKQSAGIEWPRVTIVMPVFNGAQWLEASLASATAQTYPRELLDIVVIDDGSTDASGRIAAECLSASGIQHRIVRVSNAGPGGARNLGWRESSAVWIQFLDADDLIAPDKIAIQTREALTVCPDADIIYSDWQSLAQTKGRWAPEDLRSPSIGEDPVADLLGSDNFIATGSQLFRRTCLDRVGGFDQRYRLIEDVDLLLRIAMSGGRFHRVCGAVPLFWYRRHGDSLSMSDAASFHEGCIRNARMAESHWRGGDCLTPDRGRRLTAVYHHCARYFAASDRKRFEELVEQIEALCPAFVPEAPALLRNASRLIGYRRAEILSVAYRRAKAVLTPHPAKSSMIPSNAA